MLLNVNKLSELEVTVTQFRNQSPAHVLEVADHVWKQREMFISWPKKSLLFMPEAIREKYHQYTPEQKQQIRSAELVPDSRSNGPAIMTFLLAGGARPKRVSPNKEWSIHHIYDGKFPWVGHGVSTHAVNDKRYFTHSAGLVAIHPVADALADEVPYFAWLLRYEAFRLFGFDPDCIFTSIARTDSMHR
ncbi:MAG: hypothetical protein ACKVN9_08810 [Methylophilaceae bacterium]